MSGLIIERQPQAEPITLAEAKNFLRVDLTDDDALISSLIKSARELCEAFTNRSFCSKGYKQILDSFPYYTDTVQSQNAFPPSYYSLPRYSTTLWNYSQMIKLFAAPLKAVDRITYLSNVDSQFHDLVPVPALWYPGTTYAINDKIMDNNANIQFCTFAGKSNAQPPIWNKTIGGVTTETSDPLGEGTGGVSWQNSGPAAPQIGTGNTGQFGTYIVDNISEPARIFPGPPGATWPSVLYVPDAVQIHFTAGYSDDGTNVPEGIKTAIKQLVAHWYENREAAMIGNFNALPNHVSALLYAFRVMDFQPTRG